VEVCTGSCLCVQVMAHISVMTYFVKVTQILKGWPAKYSLSLVAINLMKRHLE